MVQSFFDELFNHLDPYSRYVPPRDAGEDRERRIGQAGAGLRLARRGLAIVVVEAIADGPGALAGIRPGDTIVSVDGQSAQGKDLATVTNWVAGPEETRLSVVWRGRDGRLHSADMERAVVPPETVFAQRVGESLVIQVTAFNHGTDSHLAQAIEQGLAAPHPPEGIVLDLRGDRGGLLRQAVTAADTLLPAGVVAITAGRDPEATRIWRSTSGELASAIPVVVMVDGRSASAAEILAAALADRARCRGRQLDARQGAGADHRPAARWRRAVRNLEPRAGTARLAHTGPGRAATGLHQPGAGHAELADRCPGARASDDGEGAGVPITPPERRCSRRKPSRSATPAPRPRAVRRTWIRRGC